MAKSESTAQAIRRYIEAHGSATGPGLAQHLGITRQAVSLHLRRLLYEGVIFKTGSTRAARYFPRGADVDQRQLKRRLVLAGLDESRVYETVATTLNLSSLRDNVESIVHYAFTEILNNAIDHSMAEQGLVDISVDASRIAFSVRDRGIGVFRSIADKLGLEDEHAAMIELVKGKTTTQPDRHSGEGIFFVSRAADRFVLESHRLRIEWNRDRDDVFVSDIRLLKGTLARFQIRNDSRVRLADVFAEYAPEDYDFQFQKTRVRVKLLQRDYVSRSEAKRLLHNLDRFREVELDMRDVAHVGQGFADEIFRVFTTANPGTRVTAVNAGGAVAAMIRHAGGACK
jgi:anti-sigma regulatory factor (Ser/Thr protein kinase)